MKLRQRLSGLHKWVGILGGLMLTVSTTQATANFDEALYLFANSDVKQLIQQGKHKSGLEHYEQVGQTAKKPDGEEGTIGVSVSQMVADKPRRKVNPG